MSIECAIEKLQKVAKEKEAQKSEHKQRQEEEAKLLRKKEVEEELRRANSEGVLNIRALVVRSSSHSSSSLECVEGKTYNERIQFVHTIIHDINRTGTSAVKLLHRRKHWHANV